MLILEIINIIIFILKIDKNKSRNPKTVFFQSLPKSHKKKYRREIIAMPSFYGRKFIAILLDSTVEN